MTLNCAIVDDEPLALNLLESYVNKTPFLTLAGKYSSAVQAMKELPGKQIDLLFLDIQMPELNGLEFSKMVNSHTRIVFTTAFGQYVTNPFYVSMAAYPYINTSAYGAYLTLQNEKIGLSLGVQREYDPFRRQWITDPIIMPSFKMGKTTIQIDFGPALRYIIQNLIHKDQYNQGPIIPHP